MKILVVEDQPALRILIGGHLSERGFTVDEVSRADDAMAATAVSSYDAIILDLGLLDADGLELLARLAGKAPIKTPVLVVGARDGVEDRGRALDIKADDYLVTPIDPIELETRLRVLLRRPRH
ncbi:response regulator transcription factor [Bradyrhizobium sp. INPA03-11B]|uniref:response regulator transcription factor n=1 Tax=Bradyrhizobium sp. INPA03-11B TaxID=418598 RepID=UPI00338D6FC0